MYTVLSNLEKTVLRLKDEKKIDEYDVIAFRHDLPRYDVKALDLKILCKIVRAYGGRGTEIVHGAIARASFHWDETGFDGACQLAKALHALGYDTNIIHEQNSSMTTVEWR